MPRIRTIKPEFPQSESIGRLSRDARLLHIQLWTLADDEGRLRAAPKMLASLLYPYDDDAPALMAGWLDELEDHGHIRRYVIDGASYLEILKWTEHQKIDHPKGSKIPPFREPSRAVAKRREASRSVASRREASRAVAKLSAGSRIKDQGSRIKEGDQVYCAVAPATRTDEKFEEFKKSYPKRKGANPWKPARAQWDAQLKAGADADQIIAAIRAGTGFDRDKIGTEYIPQAVKWLRDMRFDDYNPPRGVDMGGKVYLRFGSSELDAWDDHVRKLTGKSLPRDKHGGWWVEDRWPPGHDPPQQSA